MDKVINKLRKSKRKLKKVFKMIKNEIDFESESIDSTLLEELSIIAKIDDEITEDKINMILSDKGPGIEDIELAMKEGYSTAPDNIRSLGFGAGMGLPNIKKYSDTFEIETEVGVGTTLKLAVLIE